MSILDKDGQLLRKSDHANGKQPDESISNKSAATLNKLKRHGIRADDVLGDDNGWMCRRTKEGKILL